MRIDYAFLADSANVPPDGKVYVLGGGFTQLNLAQLPGRYAFAVVAGFHFEGVDVGRQLAVELRFVDADGKLVLPPATLQFQSAGPPPAEQREWSIPTVTYLQPMFGEAGTYAAEYWHEGRLLAHVALQVQPQPPGAAGPHPN